MKITHRTAQQLAETVARIIIDPDGGPPDARVARIAGAFHVAGMITSCVGCGRAIAPGGLCPGCRP